MIKNVIFDIGNVLTNYRPHDFMADMGYSEEEITRLMRATTLNPSWGEYDRGVLTAEEILRRFVRNDPEIEGQIRKTFANMKGLVTKRDFAIPWLEELKARGLKVFYLSNYSEQASIECSEALDFIPYMDGGILSFKEKVIKPQPEIYTRLLERYNLKAEECVFIDDTALNIVAGEELGIKGILFKELEQVKEELDNLLNQ